MASTLARVAFDTSSGRVDARETVETETPALLATSLMLIPMPVSFAVRCVYDTTINADGVDHVLSSR